MSRRALVLLTPLAVILAVGIALLASDSHDAAHPKSPSPTSPTIATLPYRHGDWVQELVDMCNLREEPHPIVKLRDRATGELISFRARDYCLATVPFTPSPTGDLTANLAVIVNGRVHPDYFKVVETNAKGHVTVTAGAPVPYEEAQRIIAEQHAAIGR
jgi:hypothetical protein